MYSSFKATIKHSLIYGLGNISSKLVGLILLPLYTNSNYLSTSEFGILVILEITGQIIVSLFSLNISTAMMRWSSEVKNETDKKSIIFTSLSSTVVISLTLLILFLPFRENFSIYFFDSTKFSNYFLLLFLSSSFGIYNLIPLTIMRLREKSSLFAVLNTLKFTITLLLNFYFLAYKNMGIEGILLSQLIGQLFLTLFSLPITIKNLVYKFNVSVLREMISYGAPLVFSTIFALAFTMSDRFVIKYFTDEASVGVYSLGHKIASVINILVLQSFQLGFLPIAYKKLGTPDEKPFFSKILTYYTLALVFVALSISLYGKELIELLAENKDFWSAYSVIPIISFAFVLKGIQYVFSLSFHYSKRTSYNAGIVTVSAMINVTLNIILVQFYGYVGAAYSMLISIFIMMLLSYFFGQKVYYIPYEKKKVILIISIGLVLFGISLFISDINLAFRLLIKTLLLPIFIGLLLLLGVFSKNEILKFKQGAIDFRNLIFKRSKKT